MVEFTMVGIPLIFVLISTFEMGRGMFIYHTLAYSVKEATRYAIVHGSGCASPNSCTVTLAQVSAKIRDASAGLDPAKMKITFTPTPTNNCTYLSNCLTKTNATTDVWPPAGSNAAGLDVRVSATYPFQSMIVMFWPGHRAVSGVGTFNLPAASRERIQF
jgi:hypothetical protein